MRRYSAWIKLFGVALWVYIVSRLDFTKVLQSLLAMDLVWLVASTVCVIGMFVFKALRWRVVIATQGVEYTMMKTLGITFVAAFVGLMVPGKMGDIIKISYVKDSGLTVARGIIGIVLDRLYDLATLFLFCTIGLVVFSGMFPVAIGGAWILLLAILLGGSILFVQRGRFFSAIRRMLGFILSPSAYESMIQEWGVFRDEFLPVARKTAVRMTLYSGLAYVCLFAQFFALARGLGVGAGFGYLSFSYSVATIVSLIPITVGGLGTREAVFIYLLGTIAVPQETCVLLLFLDLMVFTVLIPGVVSLPFWLRRDQ